jgi:hypothetical protein
MKSERSKPVALAVWLLRHLTPKKTGEAIAGDLVEQFNEHGSAGKFWRETLVAILAGLPPALLSHWLEISLALSATILDRWLMRLLWKNPTLISLWVSGMSLNFPLSTLWDFGIRAAMESLVVLPVLILLPVSFRALTWAKALRVLLIFFVLAAVSDLAVSMLTSFPYSYQPYRFAFAFLLCLWLIRSGIGKPQFVQDRVVR